MLILLLLALSTPAHAQDSVDTACRRQCTYRIPNMRVSYTIDNVCLQQCYARESERRAQARLDDALIRNLDADTELRKQMRRELRQR